MPHQCGVNPCSRSSCTAVSLPRCRELWQPLSLRSAPSLRPRPVRPRTPSAALARHGKTLEHVPVPRRAPAVPAPCNPGRRLACARCRGRGSCLPQLRLSKPGLASRTPSGFTLGTPGALAEHASTCATRARGLDTQRSFGQLTVATRTARNISLPRSTDRMVAAPHLCGCFGHCKQAFACHRSVLHRSMLLHRVRRLSPSGWTWPRIL